MEGREVEVAGNAGRLKLKAQLMRGEEIALGPGKADLLAAIAAHGSISAAGRALGLSYRRAWLMVDTMNRCFAAPLVRTHPGGRQGAELTDEGSAVLASYRALVATLEAAAGPAAEGLLGRLKPEPPSG
ncbi:winged helix-turn-helix domain-containing protein [Thermaurantiacus tibetensis]|uniref:winged helix-turn-helix domain-containing protein n=1 Tax=Thermaurantiacus tibetensis TaxID=2759035 RepID=UPI00188E0DFA|nr:LysR family transcriptional regulator [Thermaurantiacus tibetensis]